MSHPYPPGMYVVVDFVKGNFFTDRVARALFRGQRLEVIRTSGLTNIVCRWVDPLTDEMRRCQAYRSRIEEDGTMMICNPILVPAINYESPEMEAWCEYDQQPD